MRRVRLFDALEAEALVECRRLGCSRCAEADTLEGFRAGEQLLDKLPPKSPAPVRLRDIDMPEPPDRLPARVVGIAIEPADGDQPLAVEEAEEAFARFVEAVGARVPVGDEAVEEGVAGEAGFEGEGVTCD